MNQSIPAESLSQTILLMRTYQSFEKCMWKAKKLVETKSAKNVPPLFYASWLWSIVMSSIGERPIGNDEEIFFLRSQYFEIIVEPNKEFNLAFKKNNNISISIAIINKMDGDNFQRDFLTPLAEINLELLMDAEFTVIQNYLKKERKNPEWIDKSNLQICTDSSGRFIQNNISLNRSGRNFWQQYVC